MKKIVLSTFIACTITCLSICTIASSAVYADTGLRVVTTQSTEIDTTWITYETLPLNQQQFVDGFVNSLSQKMNNQTDAYYIKDIISDLTKLKSKQPKLQGLITIVIEKLNSTFASDLVSLEQNDGLDPIRIITTNKSYMMSKKQFIKIFKEKALQKINSYSNNLDRWTVIWQIKTQIDELSGSLTKQDIIQLKNHINSITTPQSSWVDYNIVLSSLDSTYPSYGNSTIGSKFVQWPIKDGDFTYAISSKVVDYTWSIVLDLFTNVITRLNSNINFNVLSESSIKATVANGTIIQVLVSTTNTSLLNQAIPSSWSPIVKDSHNMQHVGYYYSSNANSFIKPQETLITPYYFIIDKWANVDYVVLQWPFTNTQWAYLIETK